MSCLPIVRCLVLQYDAVSRQYHDISQTWEDGLSNSEFSAKNQVACRPGAHHAPTDERGGIEYGGLPVSIRTLRRINQWLRPIDGPSAANGVQFCCASLVLMS